MISFLLELCSWKVEFSPLFCIAALGPGSLFGLATFSHKLGLYDVQGPIPVVKNVLIPPDLEGTLPIEIEDVMPLLQFLAPVGLLWGFVTHFSVCMCDIFFLRIKSGDWVLMDMLSTQNHVYGNNLILVML